MTELLKKAFDEAAQLPEDQQDAIASLLLEELKSDRAWGQAFDRSQDTLEKLADEAIRDHKAGKTDRLDPPSL
jgi:hypothetical protein